MGAEPCGRRVSAVCTERLLSYSRIKAWSEAAPGRVLRLGEVRGLRCERPCPFKHRLAGRERTVGWMGSVHLC